MYKIKGELSGGMPSQYNEGEWEEYVKIIYARTRIGLVLKSFYMKLFYDWVVVSEVDKKDRI